MTAASTLQVRVVRRQYEAHGIVSFELAHPQGAALPAFSAGSHVDVKLHNGIVRQYSLCNSEDEQHRYRIAVLHDSHSRGGSRHMHDAVAEGDLLEISAPRNHFPLVPARRTLLFAGGIGVTPLLCMAQQLASTGADFLLHYCTRSPEHTAFRGDIATASYAGQVVHHYDNGEPEQKLDARQVLRDPHPDVHIYICGPQGFIDHITSVAKCQGWPAEQVYVEHFTAGPVDTADDLAFDVRIASTGEIVHVLPEQTIVQALHARGVDVMVSCEQGVCGTCLTRVLAGECDHRDLYLTDEEKARHDQFTPCCSRAKCPLLVLDL